MTDLEYIEQIFLLPEGAQRERRFRQDPALRQMLPELYRLDGIPQRPDYHPEGDVLTHTLLAIRHLPENPDRRLAWGALLHDIGKAATTRVIDGRIRAFGHDRAGVELTEAILNRLGIVGQEQDDILWLVRHHMFALSWQVAEHDQLSSRQWRFVEDSRFNLLLELMKIDALASGANPEKLRQVDFYHQALRQLPR
ncbi:HD domain-containing protein [Trichloromonas sp.]|uniref:HD domain-containing protein n=1 Tax=Trichloromonas sp. TaxID=3069249 RepID=UPI003D8158B1